jgi:hypothetical protein
MRRIPETKLRANKIILFQHAWSEITQREFIMCIRAPYGATEEERRECIKDRFAVRDNLKVICMRLMRP